MTLTADNVNDDTVYKSFPDTLNVSPTEYPEPDALISTLVTAPAETVISAVADEPLEETLVNETPLYVPFSYPDPPLLIKSWDPETSSGPPISAVAALNTSFTAYAEPLA